MYHVKVFNDLNKIIMQTFAKCKLLQTFSKNYQIYHAITMKVMNILPKEQSHLQLLNFLYRIIIKILRIIIKIFKLDHFLLFEVE